MHRKRLSSSGDEDYFPNGKRAAKKEGFSETTFLISLKAIKNGIRQSPIEENDRADLIKGVQMFFDAEQQLLTNYKDIRAGRTNDLTEDDLGLSFLELRRGWDAYKIDLTNTVKSPYRTEYINYCHAELLKIGTIINELVTKPPVTPHFIEHGLELIESILKDIIYVLKSFKQFFIFLLDIKNFNIDMVDKTRNPLRIFRSNLTNKYAPFFLVEGKDKPTETMNQLLKYIDRILKKTQHIATKPNDTGIFEESINEIDAQMDKLQKKMNTDNISLSGSASILSSRLDSISEFTSVVAPSEFDGVSSYATGMTSFYENASTVSGMRDRKRLLAPWFQKPLFKVMDEMITRMTEHASITAARNNNKQIYTDAVKHFIEDAYGERDVLNQQIENAKFRISKTEKRHNHLSNRYQILLENMKKIDPVPEIGNGTKEITQSMSGFLDLLVEWVKDAENEKKYFAEADVSQKSSGSAAFDVELKIYQDILDEHERAMEILAKLKKDIKKTRMKIDKVQEKITEQQKENFEISQVIKNLEEENEKKKARIKKRVGKIEFLKGEIFKLKAENESMTAIELDFKRQTEEKIAELDEEIRKLRKKCHKKKPHLIELKEKHNQLQNISIPDLDYSISKRSEELKFQMSVSIKQKQLNDTLMMKAMAKQLSNLIKH